MEMSYFVSYPFPPFNGYDSDYDGSDIPEDEYNPDETPWDW